MKKVALFVVLFSMMTISAKAQWFDFSNNLSASVGLNLGAVGYKLDQQGLNTDLMDFGIGASVTLGGVYLDFIYQNPEHRYSEQVGVADWHDHTALTINAGYQIPILSWLYITPLVGYSNETTGITYANHISAQHNSIVHKYKRETIDSHFNYGVGLTIKPIRWVSFGAVATSHAIYGNISISASR
jgi:hypothetical protein